MNSAELESYLHAHIPLSSAMGVTVRSANDEAVVLHAPLGPNINHRDTVFGGSASALAILAGWSLVHLRLTKEGVSPRIVIQRNTVEYNAPMLGDFDAGGDARDLRVHPLALIDFEAFVDLVHMHS